jgi:hypothetical protein
MDQSAFRLCGFIRVDGLVGIVRMAIMLAGACGGNDVFYFYLGI